MMKKSFNLKSAATAIVLTTALLSTAAFGDSASAYNGGISVDVNGASVQFNGQQPIETNGSVLVPLRGVFEAMGANVDYNSADHTILANKGDRSVLLPLGSMTAQVNGVPTQLSQPAQVINGTTLVPLRFVAESLGSYVDWQSASSTVEIQTNTNTPAVASVSPPIADTSSYLNGTVRSISTGTVPRTITVRVDGEDRVVPVTDRTLLLRGAKGTVGTQVALSEIMPGDRVTIRENDRGNATRVAAVFDIARGRVSSVGSLNNGDSVIVLTDGRTINVASTATVRRDGHDIPIASVHPDEEITIHINPDSNVGYNVIVGHPYLAHER
jgi:hypothetical protein